MTDLGEVGAGDALLGRARTVLQRAGDLPAAWMLERVRVVLEPDPERWTIRGQAVDAHRAVLLAPVEAILELRRDAGLRERLRAALAAAFDGPTRVLRDVCVVLDEASVVGTPSPQADFAHPYRGAPAPSRPPHAGVVRVAAERLSRLAGESAGADLLARSRVEVETAAAPPAPDSGGALRVRVCVPLDDLARARRDPALLASVEASVRAVAQGPRRPVLAVDVVPDVIGLGPAPAAHGPAATAAQGLRETLAANGIATAVVCASAERVRMVAARGNAIAIVDVGPDEDADRDRLVGDVRVAASETDPARAAGRVRDALGRCGTLPT
jgi:hypothetical protein